MVRGIPSEEGPGVPCQMAGACRRWGGSGCASPGAGGGLPGAGMQGVVAFQSLAGGSGLELCVSCIKIDITSMLLDNTSGTNAFQR